MSQVVFVLTLRFDVYEMTKFVGDQPIVSTLFPDWRVAADAILRAGRSALAKIIGQIDPNLGHQLSCDGLDAVSGGIIVDGDHHTAPAPIQSWV